MFIIATSFCVFTYLVSSNVYREYLKVYTSIWQTLDCLLFLISNRDQLHLVSFNFCENCIALSPFREYYRKFRKERFYLIFEILYSPLRLLDWLGKNYVFLIVHLPIDRTFVFVCIRHSRMCRRWIFSPWLYIAHYVGISIDSSYISFESKER